MKRVLPIFGVLFAGFGPDDLDAKAMGIMVIGMDGLGGGCGDLALLNVRLTFWGSSQMLFVWPCHEFRMQLSVSGFQM